MSTTTVTSFSLPPTQHDLFLEPRPSGSKEQCQNSFLDALSTANIPLVKHFLMQGADPNQEIHNPDGTTTFPLFQAYLIRHVELVKCLLAAGADVDKIRTLSDGSTSTLLLTAVYSGNPTFIELFMQSSKEQIINETDTECPTGAIFNIMNRNFQKYGPEAIDTRLGKDQRLLSSIYIERLLKNGANPNAYIMLEDDSMTTLLYEAVKAKDQKLIKMFLDWGADPNKRIVDQAVGGITSSFKKATADLTLTGIFFVYSKPQFKLEVDQAIKKLEETSFLPQEKRISLIKLIAKRLLPPVNYEGVCFHTKFVSKELRQKVVECHIEPFVNPPESAKKFLSPLLAYAKKSFAQIFVIRKSDRIKGCYLLREKDITLFLDIDENPEHVKNFTAAAIEKMREETTLIHEMTHKIDFEIGRYSDNSALCISRVGDLEYAALEEIKTLANEWKCDAAIRKHLEGVTSIYPESEHLMEYLARLPQIIFDISKRGITGGIHSSEDVEAILKKDIPNLFTLYKDEFLPTLHNKYGV